jgi:3-dehydroquinate synthase
MFHLPTRIYFTGFMATGKTRLSGLVGASLKWNVVDIDALIEKQTDRSISEIFEEEGEDAFRRMEVETIRDVSKRERVIISLGGGALKNPEVQKIVKSTGILIGLWATPETILERINRKDNRPLMANLSSEEKLTRIREMLVERKSLYELADFQIESTEKVPHHVLTKHIITRIQLEALKPLQVNLGDRSYPIYTHGNLENNIGALAAKVQVAEHFVVVTDQNLKQEQRGFLKNLTASLSISKKARVFYFKTGEQEKSLNSVNRLITYLLKHQYSRKTTIVAFGGGIVGDMAGFAAAIYLRGVNFIQVPSTLLAMVDSSVGGKTGVNHKLGKNLIGAFYQPSAVAISTNLLKTLPKAEFLAGIAEVVKYGVIWDASFFSYLEENVQTLLEQQEEVLTYTIEKCCAIKAEIVGQDERESGIRAILNYGHTFGHAIELAQGYNAIPHGHAVALGMRVAAQVAVSLNMISKEQELRQNTLLDRFGLPKQFDISPEQAWKIMGLDKKVDGKTRVYILPNKIGSVELVRDIDPHLIQDAWSVIS